VPEREQETGTVRLISSTTESLSAKAELDDNIVIESVIIDNSRAMNDDKTASSFVLVIDVAGRLM
jgi:hypothetical protein